MSSFMLSMTGRSRLSDTSLSFADLVRMLVSLTIAASGIVFSEPAPVDLLMIVLIALLPLAGLQVYTPALMVYLMLWLACGAGALIAATASSDWLRSTIHTGVSFYLYLASFVLAAFVAHSPQAHTTLLLRASVAGALLAATAAIVGYGNLLPGAYELFTKFGRATGTFKDPNVLGPFLAPAILYCLHLVVSSSWRDARVPLGIAAFLSLALLLSFSRGAWINLAVALVIFAYIAFVTAPDAVDRLRLLTLGALGLGLLAAVVIVALQFDGIAALMAERSSLQQGYDLGPDGRFGGHEKAKALILDNPLGIGATQFATLYHHEDVHNVYLSMFLNAGWLGGVLYCIVVAMTLLLGLRHLARAHVCRPLFAIAYAALVGNVVEGMVIDSDHWRHFYLLLAIVWGLMSSPRLAERAEVR
ncbi:MAG: O-antigen ligase family protein [Hyphomicrobiaceae bacterium]